jgi:hypothetical protein
MSNFVFQVNGSDVPIPPEFGWSIQDVSAPDSGLTLDGLMQKERVTRKEKIQLKWNGKSPEDTATILQAFADEYFDVTYVCPLTNSVVTKQFYCGDQSAPYYWWCNGGLLESVSFNIIER